MRQRWPARPPRVDCVLWRPWLGAETGDVLIDEIPFMLRCGFDSFEVANAPTLKALEAGRLPDPPIHYQPGSGGGEASAGSRPWLRASTGRAA